ncbi:putative RNA-binding protein 18 [Lamellibrachia satsuma]|nr:putative RNA-binding protein 18 [Lamellibrachia satsuma]
MDQFERLPLPPPDDQNTPRVDERRLWIGNLDTRITEFSLLKLLQRYGKLEKFDFLYHKNGPDKGKPRGFCFVTFNNKTDAENALKGLDGKSAMNRRLAVRHAHADTKDDVLPKDKSSVKTPVVAQDASISKKIHSIEAKLRQMEHEATSSTKPDTQTTQQSDGSHSTQHHWPHPTQSHRPHNRRPYDRTHKCVR